MMLQSGSCVFQRLALLSRTARAEVHSPVLGAAGLAWHAAVVIPSLEAVRHLGLGSSLGRVFGVGG